MALIDWSFLVNRSNRGFTLIEVMIAILIFGLTAGAISVASSQAITSTRQIEEQTEARWVAQNYLTELRLQQRLPEAGTKTTKVSVNNKNWIIELDVSLVETDIIGPFLRRVVLRTKIEGDEQHADILNAVLGVGSSR